MSRNSCTVTFFLLLLVALVPSSLGFLGPQTGSQPEKVKPTTEKAPVDEETRRFPKLYPSEPIKPAANDDELRKLQIARFNEAFAEVQLLNSQLVSGGPPTSLRPIFELIFDANKRLLESRLELNRDSKEEIEIRDEYVGLSKFMENLMEKRVKEGEEHRSLATKARYLRLDAEIQLLMAKRKLKK
jgi:hypothetical protein